MSDPYYCRFGYFHPVITLAEECSGVSHGIEEPASVQRPRLSEPAAREQVQDASSEG